MHLDRAAVHEVQLLLLVVEMRARLDARGQHDRVDAERGDAEALADLAKPGPVAEVVEVGHRVALAGPHVGVLARCLHLMSSSARDGNVALESRYHHTAPSGR